VEPSSICLVIPTKNEELTIDQVIETSKKEISDLGHNVVAVIVTDDSTDGTRRIARSTGAVIVNGGGKGLGHAMFKGLKYALPYEPDIIVSMDSDGQTEISELEKFIQPILDDKADMVIGSRFQQKDSVKYRYRHKNRLGIHILVRILRWLTGLKLTDSHGGLRAMRREVVQELEMVGTHTYVQETIIDAVEKGFRVKEISSIWKNREAGKSRVVSSIPTYIFYTLPVLILRSGQHIKTMYSAGILFLFLAFFDFIIVGVQTTFSFQEMLDRQSFHLIALLISLGLQLFFFGFMLEIISGIKRKIDNLESRKTNQYKNR